MRRLLAVLLFGSALPLVFASTAAAGGGCHAPGGTSAAKSEGAPLILVAECRFVETVLFVEPGTTVSWVNKDEVPHTVTGAGGEWGDEEILSRGDRVSHVFKEAGAYPYFCVLHPSMVGTVVVGDPSAGVTSVSNSLPEVVAAPIEAASTTEGPLDHGPASSNTGSVLLAASSGFVGFGSAALWFRRRQKGHASA